MRWSVTRDGGEWSIYPCGAPWGEYASREEALDSVRQHQTREVLAAETGVEIAKKRLQAARRALSEPVKER